MSPLLNFKPDAIRLSKRSNLSLLVEEGMGKTSKCLQTMRSKDGPTYSNFLSLQNVLTLV
jgi:hypothetical protein